MRGSHEYGMMPSELRWFCIPFMWLGLFALVISDGQTVVLTRNRSSLGHLWLELAAGILGVKVHNVAF